jgi:hypothetical protein
MHGIVIYLDFSNLGFVRNDHSSAKGFSFFLFCITMIFCPFLMFIYGKFENLIVDMGLNLLFLLFPCDHIFIWILMIIYILIIHFAVYSSLFFFVCMHFPFTLPRQTSTFPWFSFDVFSSGVVPVLSSFTLFDGDPLPYFSYIYFSSRIAVSDLKLKQVLLWKWKDLFLS